jgi:hypothetical protein
MVAGDKDPLDGEEPPDGDVAVELPGAAVLERSKASWVKPVVVAALREDFDVVSDCNSPSADEAAAMSMAKLPDTPQQGGPISCIRFSKRCAREKTLTKQRS